MHRFLLDENLSPRLAGFLRRLKYGAKAVRDVGLKGKNDKEIIAWLQHNNYILITSDTDFGEFFYFGMLGKFGVIALHIKSRDYAIVKKILLKLHNEGILQDIRLSNSLLVFDQRKYRWRKFD